MTQSSAERTTDWQSASNWDSPRDRSASHRSAGRRGGVDLLRKSHDKQQPERNSSLSTAEGTLPEIQEISEVALHCFLDRTKEEVGDTGVQWQTLGGSTEDVREEREDPLSALGRTAAAFQSSGLFSMSANVSFLDQ